MKILAWTLLGQITYAFDLQRCIALVAELTFELFGGSFGNLAEVEQLLTREDRADLAIMSPQGDPEDVLWIGVVGAWREEGDPGSVRAGLGWREEYPELEPPAFARLDLKRGFGR